MSWTNTAGPVFGNTIATLELSGRKAEVLFEQPDATSELHEVARVPLGGRRPTVSPVAR